jgi:hypothetical protein
VLGQPAPSLVIRIQTSQPLPLPALLRAAVGEAMPQALTSSFSFSASAMTFWATWLGTSS